MTQRVVLVRHGQTDWAEAMRHTGRTDVPLNARGRQTAASLRARLAGEHFESVLVSPLQRARGTAALAGLDGAIVTEELVEWDYGDMEGRTTAEIRTEIPGWTVWRNGPTGGETIDQVAARADRLIERVRSATGDVALVAHAHLLRVLSARWLGQPAVFAEHLVLHPASLSVLGTERETPVLLQWNAIS
jgi:broad specificity phosphatase PhoE